ncbi:flavin reductase family protein [Hoyosella sp. YIM 151337]|uniref:flavin reductase family protein n=1 Tax=Hoyosella sp. YIM 151337 TaxID=2992742 RepID=UPI00223603F5|nr:flavin reductase family protein [Hoyosella sp. YIM 151337]MCW4352393.1 flavin reductase family protein [Hoyosella sp. YIM 151337]
MNGAATALALDSRELRQAYAAHPSGVVALCATTDGERTGMALSSFVPVSLEPPLVAVCIQNTSTTWPKLLRAEALGISVLGTEHTAAVRALASKSGDRFAGVHTESRRSGALFLAGSPLTLEVTVHDVVAAGDHQLVLLAVRDVTVWDEGAPLVFHRSSFHRLAG